MVRGGEAQLINIYATTVRSAYFKDNQVGVLGLCVVVVKQGR